MGRRRPASGDFGVSLAGQGGLWLWRPGQDAATQITDQPVVAVAWNPQHDTLAIYSALFEATGSQAIRLWQPATGQLTDLLTHSDALVPPLAWSPDGQSLASGSVILATNGQQGQSLPGDSAQALAWGPQGLFYSTMTEPRTEHPLPNLHLWQAGASQLLDTQLGMITSYNDETTPAGLIFPPQ